MLRRHPNSRSFPLVVFPALIALAFLPPAARAAARQSPAVQETSASQEAANGPVLPPPPDAIPAGTTPAGAEAAGAEAAEGAKGSEASAEADQAPKNWMSRFDGFFGTYVVKPLDRVLFFDFWTKHWLGTSVPLLIVWLIAGALFFTIRMGFINLRGFWHAIRITKGDYDDPNDEGEVSHFQALASALSATVGLGNIAGVAIAVATGGPGAIFWLILGGFLGMSTKFAECTLGQLYRKVDPDGTVSGGPMHYLRDGLAELGFRHFGAFLATLFAVVCIGGSFGGGCVFQVSQSLEAVRSELSRNGITLLNEGQYPWIWGVVLMVLVGVVILGGIRRIAATAEKIVPLMCGVYVAAALYILASNYTLILPAFVKIFEGAFTANAAYGGFLGVMVIGIRRAAFSNEAGLGSASIAHAAAKTDEPVSEGIVALLEPFIDTVVVCTMTGLVIVITDVCHNDAYTHLIDNNMGAPLTTEAFRSAIWWFPWILTAAVVLFAYSTLISWSYYGERCWSHLFGSRTALLYRLLFLGFVLIGSIASATNLLEFADLMILSMAFPNILGVALLSGKIRGALDDYWRRLKAGELDRKGDKG